MKRGGPLKRTDGLKRISTLKRSSMQRRPSARAPELVDDTYRDWLMQQACIAPVFPPCFRRVEVHHPRQYAGGVGLRGPDRTGLPMCNAHHVHELHALTGVFKGWHRERLQAWERSWVELLQARYTSQPPA